MTTDLDHSMLMAAWCLPFSLIANTALLCNIKTCIDFHFSTYVFLRLTCFQHAGLPSRSSCAKSMSWWLQNPLKFQFSTLLKILQPSFGKAKHIPMALFVCLIICVSHSTFWWKWFGVHYEPGTKWNAMQWIPLRRVFSTRTWLSLSFVCLFFCTCEMYNVSVFNTFVLKGMWYS